MISNQEKRFGISEVVEKLKREYHKLSKSMIRFWEKEGLISPKRTQGGHRKYTQQDVERMRVIAELRQKKYLPLSVVKHIIQRLDQDPTYDIQLFDEVFRPEDHDEDFQPFDRTQAAKEIGLSLDQINEIEHLGFLPGAGESKANRMFDEVDLQILVSLKEIVDTGLSFFDIGFFVEDIKTHVKHEAEFWKKVRRKYKTTEERKWIKRNLLNTTRKIRSLVYNKYGGLEIGNVLESD
jgi:DNA-binding transcriptional MerR regulator